MAGECFLELLLPELQRLILLQLDSFEALHALILASPRFYQLFKINREVAISNIARRRFNCGTILATLAIERLKQLESPPFSRENVLRFFEFTPSELEQSPNSILPLSVSTELCRSDRTIQFFADDYTENTLPILAQLQSSKDESIRTQYRLNIHDAPCFHLSETELSRVRRALCGFETYRKLFAGCSSGLDHNDHDVQRSHPPAPLNVFEQGKMFFRSTPAYYIAGIACVRDYLCRRLRGVFDQVEDETVRTLQAECPNPVSMKKAMDWDTETGGRFDYFYENDFHLFTYGGKIDQDCHIEHVLSLGLPYIRKILEATGNERRDLLLREPFCPDHHERDFLTATLGLDPHKPPSKRWGWRQGDRTPSSGQAIRASAPPGWLWAHGERGYSGLAEKAHKGFRDWGYVFWDLDRLQSAGLLDRDPREVSGLEFDEYLAGSGPSVQERWIGPMRPYEYMGHSETTEADEDGENDGGHEQEEEHEELEEEGNKGAGHKPLSILLLAFKRLWNTGTTMLKKLGIRLRQKLSECRWILPFCKSDAQH